MMKWEQLLSARRWGSTKELDHEEARSEFQRDYDRLIFSSPFRRLQNKTQVFPLPGSIFVHNRLTHSLEVASVGRSLGRIFYNKLRKSEPDINTRLPLIEETGNIVAAACLAHDLGNPAFGHSGEAAISHYFEQGEGQKYREWLTPEQWADVCRFEGNANALRILTHDFKGKGQGSFSLTYATLAAIVKYPCASIAGHEKKQIHRKKYGFFQAEQESFRVLADALGLEREEGQNLIYKRHPLVYLVEAADDICYNIIDLEDAHRLKIMSTEEVESLMMGVCDDDSLPQRLSAIEDAEARISLLRAKAISRLISECSEVFFREQTAILEGNFNYALLDRISEPYLSAVNLIKKISRERIYKHPTVVQIEVAGYKVIGGLLEEFVPAYLNHNRTSYQAMLVDLMPRQFYTDNTDVYSKILSVLDFVSGMTDLYAVELYRRIKGMTFPSLA